MLCCFLKGNAIDLSKVNFSYLYDGTLTVENKLVLKSDTFQVFLKLDKTPEYIRFYFQNEYHDKNHHAIQISDSTISVKQKDYFQWSKFQNLKGYRILVIEIIIKGLKYYYDIQINAGNELNHTDLIIREVSDSSMILKNYLPTPKEVYFSDSTFGYSYQRNFEPALPPMVNKQVVGRKKLLLDSVFKTNLRFKSENLNKLLFFQVDSSTNRGIGFIVVPNSFPKIQTYEGLIDPLIYISTKTEFSTLEDSKNKKKGFENFWVRTLKNKERAKKSIKNYYS